MARKSLIAQNELDTAQAAYDGAVAQLKASEAQLEAATGQLKSASAQQRLAAAQELAAAAQVDQTKAALQAQAGPRTHHHPCSGQWYCRLPECRCWPDCGGEFAGPGSLSHRSGSHADAGRYERQRSGYWARAGRAKGHLHCGCYQNITFTGEVTQVRNAPITVQNVVTYDAVVQVANPDLRLKPGMTANVSFLVAERQDVIKVPTAALRFQPEGAAPDTGSQGGQAPVPQRGGGSGVSRKCSSSSPKSCH